MPGNISVVKDGPLEGTSLIELIQTYKGKLVGDGIYEKFGTRFPLLIKFIDANDDLSVQVHPDDMLADRRHQSPGKTEMWYIIRADRGATLISGFNRELNKKEYTGHLKNGTLKEILNIEKAEEDDVFFIPAGRVHTIGKGLLLAEIQQTSDVTYRIYDFDRTDSDGKKRQLHTEESIGAIDYKYYGQYSTGYNKTDKNRIQELVRCPYFTTNRLFYEHSFTREFHKADSFRIFICLEGSAEMDYEKGRINISTGDVVLIPKEIEKVNIKTNRAIKILETYIDQKL